MPLLLAIEPDKRHASFIEEQARDRLRAELIVTDSVDAALQSIQTQVPDLILTSLLLSPRDESRLQDQLRQLDALGIHVQTLVIPVLAEPSAEPERQSGMLSRLRKKRAPSAEGCDPAVFGAQIAEYLEGASKKRSSPRRQRASEAVAPAVETPASPTAPVEVALQPEVPSIPAVMHDEPAPGVGSVDAIVIDDPPTPESIAQLLEELKPISNEAPLVKAETPLVKAEVSLVPAVAEPPDEPEVESIDDADLLDVFDDVDRAWRPRQLLVIEENEYDAATLWGFFQEASEAVRETPSWLLSASPSLVGESAMTAAETTSALRQELERLRHPVARQA